MRPPRKPRRPKLRKPRGRKPGKRGRPAARGAGWRPAPPAVPGPARPPRPPGAPAAGPARPANNTTCDIYYSPNAPPAAPDVAGRPGALVSQFAAGAEASEGDSTFRWTHLLYLDADADVRDSYPAAPVNRVYVPDKAGTAFNVVFVEVVNRGQPTAYKRVFLNRQAPAWPTSQL